jgi:hypothetical protein
MRLCGNQTRYTWILQLLCERSPAAVARLGPWSTEAGESSKSQSHELSTPEPTKSTTSHCAVQSMCSEKGGQPLLPPASAGTNCSLVG